MSKSYRGPKNPEKQPIEVADDDKIVPSGQFTVIEQNGQYSLTLRKQVAETYELEGGETLAASIDLAHAIFCYPM